MAIPWFCSHGQKFPGLLLLTGNVRIVKNTWTGSEAEVIVSLISLEVVFELAH